MKAFTILFTCVLAAVEAQNALPPFQDAIPVNRNHEALVEYFDVKSAMDEVRLDSADDGASKFLPELARSLRGFEP
ncbi:MAG: hypothetical protein KVP17_001270 [Porospora cf. gigantea B]|uniref:uncharacterized protein n=1 Tax=Porospora cf. gigantea B TaxID=2853592 RepID=UPI003571EDF8|nr:MAG: hypothetical protein KVP17_001270 [Porospora cf. gigantea B]